MNGNNDIMYPFFCYFGGKWRCAKRYPKPQYQRIIEPFAGSAGYSLRHYHLKVTLYDLDPVICGIWEYLISASSKEILNLPLEVNHVNDINVCQEAKWLIGFWLNKATTRPCLTPSSWMRGGSRPNSYWGEAVRERISSQVDKIKHWKVINKSYDSINNESATWFVDPPYQGECGKNYRCQISSYESLGEWCKRLQGQVIVCEKHGAEWLPFQYFHKIKATPGSKGKSYSEEMIWTKQ